MKNTVSHCIPMNDGECNYITDLYCPESRVNFQICYIGTKVHNHQYSAFLFHTDYGAHFPRKVVSHVSV